MFKACLKYNIVPFIIEDNLKMFYYHGLKEWDNEKGYLTDTCLTAQDKYKAYLELSIIHILVSISSLSVLSSSSVHEYIVPSTLLSLIHIYSKNTQTEAGTEASGKSDSRLDDLYQQENQLFADHTDVWNKAFGMMNKSDADPSGNYADYLAGTVESNKDSFTDDELKTLNEDIETKMCIRDRSKYALYLSCAVRQVSVRYPFSLSHSFNPR